MPKLFPTIDVLRVAALAVALSLAVAADLSAQGAAAKATDGKARPATDANPRTSTTRPAARQAAPGPGYRHPDDFQPPPPAPEPPGIRAYASDIHDQFDLDLGPAAIALIGARNGHFNGKVVVASGEAFKGLKATMSDLKQGAAAIPASRTQVRYAISWDANMADRGRPPGRDVLLEAAPAEVAVVKGRAAIPVWITVSVPKDAKVGDYSGRLAIEAAGRKVADVPVKLVVRDWTIPDTQDWRTWIEMVQSPDTLSVEYALPLWSDRHFEMIGKSFRLIGQTGSRIVYVPLICRTNRGNEETMVRWVKKGDKYEPDYAVMDKYLDAAQKNLGQPKVVCFWAWEAWMNPPSEKFTTIKEGDGDFQKEEKAKMAARAALATKGVPVTALDPATGKTETVFLPKYADPAGKALWAPVWKTLHEKMKQRGLEPAMMLGCMTDWIPTKEDTVVLKELAGGLPWVSCSHHCSWRDRPEGGKNAVNGLASVGLTTLALSFQLTINPELGRTYGWQKPLLHAQFWRGEYLNVHSLSTLRHEAECQITGSQRGLGRLGGDFWFCVKDKRGRRAGIVTDRYPESYWHNLNIVNCFLAPGPDGPVATARFEALREGVQECEARIAIESVLTDAARRARLAGELAELAQGFLDEQQRNLWRARGATEEDFKVGLVNYRTYDYDIVTKWKENAGNQWFVKSGWADRVGKLYALANEVSQKGGH